MSKQDKYTKSARGQPCQIRIPYHCEHNAETVVLCHLNGAGMGVKHANIHGAYGCNICHDIVDGRKQIKQFHKDEIKIMFLEGVIRTQKIMIDEGTLKL